jgi:hypothetical protein
MFPNQSIEKVRTECISITFFQYKTEFPPETNDDLIVETFYKVLPKSCIGFYSFLHSRKAF